MTNKAHHKSSFRSGVLEKCFSIVRNGNGTLEIILQVIQKQRTDNVTIIRV